MGDAADDAFIMAMTTDDADGRRQTKERKKMFEEFKPNWYTVAICVENDWLNEKLDNFNYGKYYSVNFEGNAETYMWQAKEAPEQGKKYYGHVEPSKSGKSMRFKKDKVPEGEAAPKEANEKQGSFAESPDKQAHISRSVALNNAALMAAHGAIKPENVLGKADEFLGWLNPTANPDPMDSDIAIGYSEKDIPSDMEQNNEN